MAKKKTIQKIYVKSPKIGETYKFYFAGGPEIGVLINVSDKLSQHYGHPWYTLLGKSEVDGRDMKYPVSIYDLRPNR